MAFRRLTTKRLKKIKKPNLNYCGRDYYLFQHLLNEEQVNSWFPIKCNIENPQNCVPTSIKLVLGDLVDSDEIYEFSEKVKYTGTIPQHFIQYLKDKMRHLDIKDTLYDIKKFNILEFFKKNLQKGYASIINIYAQSKGHTTVVAKDYNDNIYILEGQYAVVYPNEEMVEYLKRYDTITIFCSKHKHKRKIIKPEYQVEKNKSGEKPLKKQRQTFSNASLSSNKMDVLSERSSRVGGRKTRKRRR